MSGSASQWVTEPGSTIIALARQRGSLLRYCVLGRKLKSPGIATSGGAIRSNLVSDSATSVPWMRRASSLKRKGIADCYRAHTYRTVVSALSRFAARYATVADKSTFSNVL